MDAGSPDVCIYVASANTNPATELCIRTIHRHAGYPFELVVGDGASQDGSLQVLRDLAGRGWLQLQEATGWRQHTEWLDEWLASCDRRYAVFVDSDVAFLQEGWLRDLVATARSTEAALVCAELGPEIPNHPLPGSAKPVRLAARPSAHLLLLDVLQVKSLGTSFAPSIEEADVPEGLISHDAVAKFFIDLQRKGLHYEVMQPAFTAKFRHWGGLSWRSRKLWPDFWPGWDLVKILTKIRITLRIYRRRWPSPSQYCVTPHHLKADDASARSKISTPHSC